MGSAAPFVSAAPPAPRREMIRTERPAMRKDVPSQTSVPRAENPRMERESDASSFARVPPTRLSPLTNRAIDRNKFEGPLEGPRETRQRDGRVYVDGSRGWEGLNQRSLDDRRDQRYRYPYRYGRSYPHLYQNWPYHRFDYARYYPYCAYRRAYNPFGYGFAAGFYSPSYVIYDYGVYGYPREHTSYTTLYNGEPTGERGYRDDGYYNAPASNPSPTYKSTPKYEADANTAAPQPASVQAVSQGNSLFVRGRFAEARQSYLEATLADEHDGYAKLFYGLASFALNDYEAAASAMRRALTTAPELIYSPIDIRQFYGDSQETWATHAAALQDWIDEQPADREARFLLGYLYFATGEPSRGLALMQRLADESPADELAALVRDAAKQALTNQESANEPDGAIP